MNRCWLRDHHEQRSFVPCGDPIPELKRQLAAEIARLIDGRRGADMAVLLETDRGRISDLRHGKLGRFSLETLIRFLTRMRYRIDLRAISPREQNQQRPSSSPGEE